MGEQHVGEWIVDFYADGVVEPIETVRAESESWSVDFVAALSAASTFTDPNAGGVYATLKHSQAPESSRVWAKVDVERGEPKWADCKAPGFWSRRQGPGVAMPGEADGWKVGDRALVAFAVGDRVEVTPAKFEGKCWGGTRYGGKYLFWADVGTRAIRLRGVDMPDLSTSDIYTYATAIIRRRPGGDPDITPRHLLAPGEVFDPWQAAAETFGVDVDAVKAAAGCPDRWWFVYDDPADGSELVKAPTKRMAGELSGFMRGSDPPHDFGELTIEPATMDALAERCLAHETAEPKPPILVVNGSIGREQIDALREQFGSGVPDAPTMVTIDTTHAEEAAERACAAQVMEALKVADPTSADWPFALKAVHEAQRDAEDLFARYERERAHTDRLIAAAGVEPYYPRANCVNEARELIARFSLVLASVLGCSTSAVAGWPAGELRVAGRRIGMTLACMPKAMRKWLGGEPGVRLPEPGDEPTDHDLLCRAADLSIALEVATGRPTATESPLGRGTEGEMRLIMILDEPRAIGVYTWTDGHDDPEPYMATPGWWGDCRLPVGGNRDIFSPDDVVIWARLPERVTP